MKSRGLDKPIILRYYGDTQRDIRYKYGRSSPYKQPTRRSAPLNRGQIPRVPALSLQSEDDEKVLYL